MRTILAIALLSFVAGGCAVTGTDSGSKAAPKADEPTSRVVSVSEVEWEKLNPARGDMSPQAGTLWGDRNGPEPTGFLAKFVDGFSSPPHIHNTTYRAVVISGLVHNDDPEAAHMWMPPGSFWTQPEGEVHITAAKGSTNIALVEIDQGPYLVLPPSEAFDNGERPINVDASNIMWVNPPEMPVSAEGPKVAYLWGSLQEGHSHGTFIKLPAGFAGEILSSADTFRAVVIQGQMHYGGTEARTLDPGSYFSSEGEWNHRVSIPGEQGTVLYVRTDGKYKLVNNRD